MKHDLYTVLGVRRDAAQADIHQAFRDLSRGYHPDHNPGGRKVFEEIQNAYKTLSSLDKRAEYDKKLGIPEPMKAFSSAGIPGLSKKTAREA